MAKDKISLTLNGDVPLRLFSEAILHFNELVNQLSREICTEKEVEWRIEDLEAGSATATIIGISEDYYSIERVVGAYETIGKALESHKPIPYSPAVVKAASSLTSILNGKVTSIELNTPDFSSYITQSSELSEKHTQTIVFGTVRGLVETLSRRQSLRFIVYDELFDKAVKCFFEESQIEMIRDIWDKKVIVSGKVVRDTLSGRPIEVREIKAVNIIPATNSKGFRQVRGIIPWKDGNEPSEKIIRRIRDEE
jgi:hypothetical protein